MQEFQIKEVLNSLTRISSDRNYWFVRTQGGLFYETFLINGYIAIGYDSIRLSTIKNAHLNRYAKKALSEAIKERFPEEKRPGYIGNQLIDFTYNIKKGDVVVIPSSSSSNISIGEVESTPVFEVNKKTDEADCPFFKRKKIKWLKKNISLESLDAQLLRLKYTQRTITFIPDNLTSFIDRNIVPLYIKDENGHLAINVQRHEHLSAYSLFSAWVELLELADEFGKEKGLEINKEDFDIRINVQSPGTIEFISISVLGLVVLTALVTTIIGADIEVDAKWIGLKYKFKTKGLLKSISDFKDRKEARISKESLNEKLKMMDLNPDEFIQILEQVNKKNENEDK